MVPLVGSSAPCTYSVYKAAHRKTKFRVVKPVSLLAVKPALLVFANPIGFLQIGFVNFCDFHSRSSPMPDLRQRMTLKGFSSKGLNKLAHALNGNHISWQIPAPHFRSKQWANSFSIPNGMIVSDYAFYSKDKLWIRYYRRGSAYGTMGHCYGRSPPSGAGREAAGRTSRNLSEFGVPDPVTPWSVWKLRAEPKTFTDGNIYVVGTSVATFTLATLATTLTTKGLFHHAPARHLLKIRQSRAATKTDELSGVLIEDRDSKTLAKKDLIPGSLSKELQEMFIDNGNRSIRIPP